MDFIKSYWQGFVQIYGLRDGLVAMMVPGSKHDVCAKFAVMEKKFGKNIQFGIVKPKNEEDRVYKIELRMKKDGTYEEYFAQSWPEIRKRLGELGEILYSDPTAAGEDEDVIAVKFVVEPEGQFEEYKRIFAVYQEFKKIILDYCSLES